MTKHFYIFRHGQTDYNLEKRLQGVSIDAELNQTGIQQAYDLAEKLKEIKIDKIYSSPLKRANQTAEIVNKFKNVELLVDKNLQEACFGDIEGLSYDEILEQYPEGFKTWFDSKDNMEFAFHNGETKTEIQKRFLNFLDLIVSSEVNHVGIATHYGMMRVLLLYLGQSSDMKLENGQVLYIIHKDNQLIFKQLLN